MGGQGGHCSSCAWNVGWLMGEAWMGVGASSLHKQGSYLHEGVALRAVGGLPPLPRQVRGLALLPRQWAPWALELHLDDWHC